MNVDTTTTGNATKDSAPICGLDVQVAKGTSWSLGLTSMDLPSSARCFDLRASVEVSRLYVLGSEGLRASGSGVHAEYAG